VEQFGIVRDKTELKVVISLHTSMSITANKVATICSESGFRSKHVCFEILRSSGVKIVMEMGEILSSVLVLISQAVPIYAPVYPTMLGRSPCCVCLSVVPSMW
jgi:hypothetical protein